MTILTATRPRAATVPMLLLLCSAVAVADAPAPENREPSKQTRAVMADLHEQMAACLRTDKSLRDCRNEMVVSCQAKLGTACETIAGVVRNAGGPHRMRPMAATSEPDNK